MFTDPKGYMESVLSGFKKTTPQQVSRDIKEASGKEPSLGMGIFMKNENGERVEPNTGLDTSDGKGDNMNAFVKYTVSDQAPLLKFLNQFIPGFQSFSDTHDKAMPKEPKGIENAYLPATIPQYVYYNYYGALGTLINKAIPLPPQNEKVDNK
jgi:hypothetical protein